MINKIHRLEYGLAFLLILIVYLQLDFSFWLFLLFILAPDITLVGYIINNTAGAIIYNIGHSLILPLLLLVIAVLMNIELQLIISCIWLAHISIDRFFGFGLKYKYSFQETHMQKV